MTVSFRDLPLDDLPKTMGTVVVFTSPAALTDAAKVADEACGGTIARAQSAERFAAKEGEVLDIPAPAGMKATRLLVVGIGDDDLTANSARTIGGKLGAALGKLDDIGATVFAEGFGDDAMKARLALGIRLRRYSFVKYRTESDPATDRGPGSITIGVANSAGAQEADTDANAVAEGTFFTRDLVSEPANILYPESFTERLQALSDLGVEVSVLDEADMTKLGMNALLAVGLGSRRESRVVIMKWLGADDKSAAPFCAVGKGVTFDTGGISIKPAGGMEEMTMDMGGAGVVSGLMKTLAMRKAKANVIGVVGLTENMPDGNATRPGDIVTAMSGTTIEIINTDAEGRLVLADVLHYTQTNFKPKATINLATLTGAMIVALGYDKAGFFSNDDSLSAQLQAAADNEEEGLWRLPLGKAYDDQIKSRLADIKNTGGRHAGSITAAQFLKRFVDDSPWAHIDIAGVALSKDVKPTVPKGASGWGVATLDRLVRDVFEDGAGA